MGEIIGVLQHSCSLAQYRESAKQAHILVIKLNKMNTNKIFMSTAGFSIVNRHSWALQFMIKNKSSITGQCIVSNDVISKSPVGTPAFAA